MPRFLLDDLGVAISGKAPDDQVFTRRGFFAGGEHANLLRLTWFRRYAFQPAVEKAGLDGLTPHGLRHTAASLAIVFSADVKVVQAMLGHASATMTLDLYGHLYPDRLDEVSDAMDSARTAARQRAAENLADSVRTGGPEPPGISM